MRRSDLTAYRTKNTFDGDVHSGEQFSCLMNLVSFCSEQLVVPEFIDVMINVMPPTVF